MTVYTALESAMSMEEQQAFLDRAVGMNPHLAGGTVADFLEMMHDTGTDTETIEVFPVPPGVERADVLADCIRAVLHSYGQVLGGRVLVLYHVVLPSAEPLTEDGLVEGLLDDVHFGPPDLGDTDEDIAELGGV